MGQDSNPNKVLCPRPQHCMSFTFLTWISVVCSIFLTGRLQKEHCVMFSTVTIISLKSAP